MRTATRQPPFSARTKRHSIRDGLLLLVAVPFIPLLSMPRVLRADVIHVKGGRPIDGRITREEGDRVRIQLTVASGEVEALYPKDRVFFVERRRVEKETLDPQARAYELGVDHHQLGVLALAGRDYGAAKSEFGRAVAVDPEDARAHLGLAIALEDSGEHEQALVHAGRAIALNPLIKGWGMFTERFGVLLSAQRTDWLSDQVQFMESRPNLLVASEQNSRPRPPRQLPQLGLDKSIDGNPIRMQGTEYAKGLGTHANSELVFNLSGRAYDYFRSWVGPDDEARNPDPDNAMEPSVVFEVYTNGELAFRSGTLTAGAVAHVNVPILGVQKLKLVVRDAGNGTGYDHADWAEASLVALGLSGGATTPGEVEARDRAAIEEARGIIAANPREPNPHNELGLIYARRGEHQAALIEFREAVRDDPRFAAAYTNAALTYAMMMQFDQARPRWEKRAGLRMGNEWDALAAEEARAKLVDSQLLIRMPEVCTRAASWPDILAYRRAVARLPERAQRWVLDTGQFMEDAKLTEAEQQVLEAVAGKPDPLIYLTSPRLMDGVGGYDVEWVQGWSPERGEYCYLDSDLDELEATGLVSASSRPMLAGLVSKAKEDPEIERGMYLIANLGRAPKELLWWQQRPSCNTQLYALCKLLERGVRAREERLAIAAALDYGATLSVAEYSVWPMILGHAYERLAFVRETAEVIKSEGADWDPGFYSLAAGIALLWPGVTMSANPLVRTVPLEEFCQDRPLDARGFQGNSVRIQTLRDMRDTLREKGVFGYRARFTASLRGQPCAQGHYQQLVDAAAAFIQHEASLPDAQKSYPTEWPRWNVNWQWGHVKRTGKSAGWCTEWGLVCAFLMRSLNIATLERPHQNWYYDHIHDVWRLDTWELASYCKSGKPLEHASYWKLPWHNFHLLDESEVETGCPKEYDPVANLFLLIPDKSKLPSKGIPSGYVFRRIIRAE